MSVKPEPVERSGLDPGIDPAPPPPASPFVQYQQRLGERQHTNTNLQHIASLTSPELLEEATAVGLKALDDLKPPLDAVACLPTTQAAQWITLIDELKAQAKPPRIIVGVVGNTGAGKSSVISAVLDEER
jgi:ribosome biogenesis GTPase A